MNERIYIYIVWHPHRNFQVPEEVSQMMASGKSHELIEARVLNILQRSTSSEELRPADCLSLRQMHTRRVDKRTLQTRRENKHQREELALRRALLPPSKRQRRESTAPPPPISDQDALAFVPVAPEDMQVADAEAGPPKDPSEPPAGQICVREKGKRPTLTIARKLEVLDYYNSLPHEVTTKEAQCRARFPERLKAAGQLGRWRRAAEVGKWRSTTKAVQERYKEVHLYRVGTYFDQKL